MQPISVAMDLSQLTQVATGLANGDLSQTAQIQTQPLEIKTKDELGNLAREFNKMIAQLRETRDAYAKMGETVKSQIADVNMLVQATIEGDLATRADASKHQGDFRQIIQGINDTLDAVTGPCASLRSISNVSVQETSHPRSPLHTMVNSMKSKTTSTTCSIF